MLGIDSRTARAAWTVLAIAALAGAAYLIRRTLLIFICAILLAYLLAPLLRMADRFRPARLPAAVSLLVLYLVIMLLLGLSASAIGTQLAEEAASLSSRIPKVISDPNVIQNIPLPAWLLPYRARFGPEIHARVEEYLRESLPLLSSLSRQVLSFLSNIVFVILVPILSFFFLKDGAEYRAAILSFADGSRRAALDDLLNDVHTLLVQYVRALVLLSLSTFLSYWLCLSLLGVPYAVLLALAGAIGEFVPVAGTLTAAVVILIVAAVSGYDGFLALILFLAGYRLFLDYVLQPLLLGSGVELPPLLVIFAVLAGEQIGGITGMFLAIPVVATLRLILVRYKKSQAALPA
ncbi:MAG: AI-2E family transporter [Bryobacterales bacterium]|nr:AI-2E family transporter [Bryobacterales bacterium]